MSGSLFQIAVFEAAFLTALIVIAAALLRGRVQWLWLFMIPVLALLQKLIMFYGGEGTFGEWIGGRYNWEGKIIGTAFWLTIIALFFRNEIKSLGFTISQSGPAPRLGLSVAVLTAIATLVFNALYFPGTKSEPVVDMLYQATMPSLDEEIWFRGLMLAFLIKGFSKTGLNNPAVHILVLAGLISSLHFWGVHSISTDGDWGFIFRVWFNPVAGIYGLLWVTVRLGTGSLLLPILLHTLANTAGYFI